MLRRFLRRRSAVAALVVLLVLFVGCYALPSFLPYSYSDLDFDALLQPPNTRHWLGTNALGQDLLAQTLRGMQKSMLIAVCVAVISTAIAATVGSISGYFGGWRDRALMWFVDLMLVVPAFLLIMILTPRFKSSGNVIVLVVLLAGFGWMVSSRMVRGMTMSLREREFIRAARYMGVPNWRIITHHVVPNVASILIIDTALNVAVAILAETGLSFLGFGIQPPDVSLGTLIADGTQSATTFPWVFLFPAGVLVLILVCANVTGDGLRDALDPASRARRADEPRCWTSPTLRSASPPKGPPLKAVRGIDFHVDAGEVVAIVGESGSGKSTAAMAVVSLLPEYADVRGSVRLQGNELIGLPDDAMSRFRGNTIGMVFQDPMSALTPVYTVGDQIAEAIEVHQPRTGKRAARQRAVELLELVGIAQPERRARAFPHELSGGERQRVVIAIAIANDPDLLICDEPTTALDVTVQAQILEVLKTARDVTGAGVLLITHDLGVVGEFADRALVMYAGRIVEIGRRQRCLPRSPDALHRRTTGLGPAVGRPAGHPAGADPGRSPVADRAGAGVPVRATLPAGRRRMPHRGAEAVAGGPRPQRGLYPHRARRRAQRLRRVRSQHFCRRARVG